MGYGIYFIHTYLKITTWPLAMLQKMPIIYAPNIYIIWLHLILDINTIKASTLIGSIKFYTTLKIVIFAKVCYINLLSAFQGWHKYPQIREIMTLHFDKKWAEEFIQILSQCFLTFEDVGVGDEKYFWCHSAYFWPCNLDWMLAVE